MPEKLTLNHFYSAPFMGGTMITGDSGRWLALTREEFLSLRSGKFARGGALLGKLAAAGFIRERMDLEAEVRGIGGLYRHVFSGPSLHILVLTAECNHACVYCRAVAAGGAAGGRRRVMSPATARKSVDMAFASPNPAIAIEFQGGEALMNWPALKAAVQHALRLNRAAGKDLSLSVVTNLSLMDGEKSEFLRAHGVGICTSLDGPAFLHDANRRYAGGSSHAKAVRWLGKLLARRAGGEKDALPSALMTTTRQSLRYPREIVETYRSLGLGGIFLRPLSPIGYAGSAWDKIGYTPAEFTAFYRAALKYIIRLNLGGERFVERNAALIARKALRREDPGFLDLRSPCGAAAGQLAYNWDGGVYTCDEGRMAGEGNDGFFRLGSVLTDSYADIAASPRAKACALASCLENQPYCSRCAWKPFCGVCPVYNYETQGTPWGGIAGGGWCETQKGIFAAVFETLCSRSGRRVLEGWLDAAGNS